MGRTHTDGVPDIGHTLFYTHFDTILSYNLIMFMFIPWQRICIVTFWSTEKLFPAVDLQCPISLQGHCWHTPKLISSQELQLNINV